MTENPNDHSEKLRQVERDVLECVAQETGDLLTNYFKEALENTQWGVEQARQEHESVVAEYAHAAQMLLAEAQRLGVDLPESSLPAIARRKKAAKGATGTKATPQGKWSPRKRRPLAP
jgi:hypothetical protein